MEVRPSSADRRPLPASASEPCGQIGGSGPTLALATARGALVSASAATDAPQSANAPAAPTVCAVLADLGQSCEAQPAQP